MFQRGSRLLARFLLLPPADQFFLLRAAVELWRVRRSLKTSGLREFRGSDSITHAVVESPNQLSADDTRPSFNQSTPQADSDVVSQMEGLVHRTVRLTQAARRLIPGHCSCLVLALAVQRLLKNQDIGSEVRIGARGSGTEFEAHAWLELSGRVVIGGSDVYEQFSLFPPLGLNAHGKVGG